jgi:hypothetical protein
VGAHVQVAVVRVPLARAHALALARPRLTLQGPVLRLRSPGEQLLGGGGVGGAVVTPRAVLWRVPEQGVSEEGGGFAGMTLGRVGFGVGG